MVFFIKKISSILLLFCFYIKNKILKKVVYNLLNYILKIVLILEFVKKCLKFIFNGKIIK